MSLALPIEIDRVKGFMDAEEGAALHDACRSSVDAERPALEIGGYCGKSAIYLGVACRAAGARLFSVDHHRGSEENQPGWDYHDPELWDAEAGALDTLPTFRRNVRAAGLEHVVVPIVGRSAAVAKIWGAPLGFLFVDGGHTLEAAMADYEGWRRHVAEGGLLAIHDVFPNPADGGRPPYEIYRLALASGDFEEVGVIKSLRLLRRC
jgi:predicted O-methyltransferase YrrM